MPKLPKVIRYIMLCWQTLDAEELLAKSHEAEDFLFSLLRFQVQYLCMIKTQLCIANTLPTTHCSPDILIIPTMAETKKVWELAGVWTLNSLPSIYFLQWARIFLAFESWTNHIHIVRDLLFLPLIRWVGAPNSFENFNMESHSLAYH